jgi:hypothetical protein
MHLIAIHYIFKSYKVELKGDKTKNQRNFKANANKNIKIHDKWIFMFKIDPKNKIDILIQAKK